MSQPEYTCPRCGGHEFVLDITQTVRVVFLENEEHDITESPGGDICWFGATPASCHDCGHHGTLDEMKPAPSEDEWTPRIGEVLWPSLRRPT